MVSKMIGHILYLHPDDVKDFKFNPFELNEFTHRIIQDCAVIDDKNSFTKKINFDILGAQDSWGGYVKGFLYEDGKFLAHFHYLVEANLPKESMSGTFINAGDGYEIQGVFYGSRNEESPFYLKLTAEESLSNGEVIKPTENLKDLNKSLKTPRKRYSNIETFPDVLNQELLENISAKAGKKKSQKTKQRFLLYDNISSWKCQPNTVDDLVLAMCVAYSWMPTMLDIYVNDKKELSGLLFPVTELGKIKSGDTVVLAAFGSGFTWASAIIKW